MAIVYGVCTQSSIDGSEHTDVRYVGVTCGSLYRRMQGHVNAALRGRSTAKYDWMREVLARSDKLVTLVLAVVPNDRRYEVEREIVSDLSQCYDLTNEVAGGGGYNCDEGYVAKGVIRREKRALQIDKIQQGLAPQVSLRRRDATYVYSDADRVNFSLGARARFSDPEERRKISTATKGLVKSPEHRAKLATAAREQYRLAPRFSCPACGYEGTSAILAMHRKRKDH